MESEHGNFECSIKPSVRSIIQIATKGDQTLGQEVRNHWEISGHCSKLLFPTSYSDVQFSTSSGSYYYQTFCNDTVPDQELVREVKGAYYKVLANLNSSSIQAKNFILPAQLMKLKYIDPYSRQRIIDDLCRFLSTQEKLRSVVLEQAGVTFPDLCRLLLSVGRSSLVKRLYLFGVLGECVVPFKGPLQSDKSLDYLPRVPFTYNPGGRKYLRELKKLKEESKITKPSKFMGLFQNFKTLSDSDAASVIAWIESLIEESLAEFPEKGIFVDENKNQVLNDLYEVDKRDFVFTQFDVAVQCDMSSNVTDVICHIPRRSSHLQTYLNKTVLDDAFTKVKIDCCIQFLKVYENSEIKNETLRQIYMIALNGLTHLTVLSVNYKLLGDGTGETLMSIGSVTKGNLKQLELLCQMEDLPSSPSELYYENACHAIPDHIWGKVKKYCPDLQVRMVCISMSNYEVTNMFVTKSIPLSSIHFDNGFCCTLIRPQIMFFSVLKSLALNFKNTLEHVDIILWHSSGRIDRSLENILRQVVHLKSFEYHGPLQCRKAINNLCDAALRPNSEIVHFKLMVQGDPCFRHIARDLTDNLYKQYLPAFRKRSINFTLGTHSV